MPAVHSTETSASGKSSPSIWITATSPQPPTDPSASAFAVSGSNDEFEFFFSGGSTNYTYVDSTGSHDSGVAWSDGGLRIAVTLTGTDTYSATVKRLNTNVTTPLSGTLSGTAGSGINT